MCCARDHYPATVGVHQVSEDQHHTHLVLPWSRLNHVVCISSKYNPVKLMWRDFNGYDRPAASAAIAIEPYQPDGWPPHPEEAKMIGDLLIVGIAESGRCSHDFLKKLIHRFNRDRSTNVEYTEAQGHLSFAPPPPDEIEEWHEWLVKVAQSEVVDYQRMMAMEKAMREAHPELGA